MPKNVDGRIGLEHFDIELVSHTITAKAPRPSFGIAPISDYPDSLVEESDDEEAPTVVLV